MVYKMIFRVDGGCRGNGQDWATGAAACIKENRWGRSSYKTQHLPRYPTPTSQRAEITAIIMALQWALEVYEDLDNNPYLDVTIYSDSKYTVDIMNDWVDKWRDNGWVNSRGLEVCNRDLIEEADDLDGRLRAEGDISYVWVPRHENEEADQCCNEALDEQVASDSNDSDSDSDDYWYVRCFRRCM
ncbi:hypothetical protein RB595_005164 [Gaeumannomyces hyphopodioides]